MRFDTSGFVTAVASRNSSKCPAAAGINHPNNSNLLSGGGGGSSGGGGADGGGGGTAAAAAAHGSASSSHPGVSDGVASSFGGAGNAAGSAMTEEESAPVVVGAGGDDGSSAAGGGGEGSHVWGVPGGKWDHVCRRKWALRCVYRMMVSLSAVGLAGCVDVVALTHCCAWLRRASFCWPDASERRRLWTSVYIHSVAVMVAKSMVCPSCL